MGDYKVFLDPLRQAPKAVPDYVKIVRLYNKAIDVAVLTKRIRKNSGEINRKTSVKVAELGAN